MQSWLATSRPIAFTNLCIRGSKRWSYGFCAPISARPLLLEWLYIVYCFDIIHPLLLCFASYSFELMAVELIAFVYRRRVRELRDREIYVYIYLSIYCCSCWCCCRSKQKPPSKATWALFFLLLFFFFPFFLLCCVSLICVYLTLFCRQYTRVAWDCRLEYRAAAAPRQARERRKRELTRCII